MKPSIGRIVHYYDETGNGPHAAIITEVHTDQCVNLRVFPRSGEPFTETSVVDYDGDDGGSKWAWPPRV